VATEGRKTQTRDQPIWGMDCPFFFLLYTFLSLAPAVSRRSFFDTSDQPAVYQASQSIIRFQIMSSSRKNLRHGWRDVNPETERYSRIIRSQCVGVAGSQPPTHLTPSIPFVASPTRNDRPGHPANDTKI